MAFDRHLHSAKMWTNLVQSRVVWTKRDKDAALGLGKVKSDDESQIRMRSHFVDLRRGDVGYAPRPVSVGEQTMQRELTHSGWLNPRIPRSEER